MVYSFEQTFSDWHHMNPLKALSIFAKPLSPSSKNVEIIGSRLQQSSIDKSDLILQDVWIVIASSSDANSSPFTSINVF